MWATPTFLLVALFVVPTVSAPSGFPASGNGLWYTKSANVWATEWLPVGNGYLAGKHIILMRFIF
jgi:alpha-L-fucosidase 2